MTAQQLEETEPEGVETRQQLIGRLRRTVAWMNEHLADEARTLATNQKERAREILVRLGDRSRW